MTILFIIAALIGGYLWGFFAQKKYIAKKLSQDAMLELRERLITEMRKKYDDLRNDT